MNLELIFNLFNKNHSFEYDKIESPIESFLLNHLIKFLKSDTQVIVQYPISTINGNFRADIVLKRSNKIVIIECDGKEYHTKEKDDWYDEWRDALILIQRKVNTIYRVKGRDIFNNIYTVFDIMSRFDSDLFDYEKIARIQNADISNDYYKKTVDLNFINEYENSISYKLEIKRKNLIDDFDRFWLKYILYSLLYAGSNKNIYELIEIMKNKIYDSKTLLVKVNEKYPSLNLENEEQLLKLQF